MAFDKDLDEKIQLTYVQRRELERILNHALRLEDASETSKRLRKDKRVYLRLNLSDYILLKYKAKTRKKSIAEYLRFVIRKDDISDRLWLDPEKDKYTTKDVG